MNGAKRPLHTIEFNAVLLFVSIIRKCVTIGNLSKTITTNVFYTIDLLSSMPDCMNLS